MVALKESRKALAKKPKKKPDHEQVEEESDLADKVKGLKLKKKNNQKTLDQQSEEEGHTEHEANQDSSKASKLKKKNKPTSKMSKKKALEEQEEEEGTPEAELSSYSSANEEQVREKGNESDGPGGAAEESDSSEDEVAPRNTIGNVPLKWYEDEDHIGYNISGKKIKKQAKRDMLDSFLADADNKKNW